MPPLNEDQSEGMPLLRIEDLVVEFDLDRAGILRAVDGVSFSIPRAGTVALVGESGSGKSVIAQSILRILPAVAYLRGGRILFDDPQDGETLDIAQLAADGRRIRSIRGRRISNIFQEPMTSLSPLHTIGDQVSEAARLHQGLSAAAALDAAEEMLNKVGIPEPRRSLHKYPFELSGGLRQRAMIAMALVCRPALLIADEPTTALDVTVQAQILELLKGLQAELRMSILLITHDLGVVANMADEIVVVYRGKLMESGMASDLLREPRHPYLRALMRAVPRVGMGAAERLMPIREIERERGGYLSGQQHASAPEADSASQGPILQVSGVSKSFGQRKGSFGGGAPAARTQALSGIDLHIERGECLGLVGESGCGKTTLSKIIMRAMRPDHGQVLFDNGSGAADVHAMEREELLVYRRRVQFVFQDPFGSLDPRMTVLDIVKEPLDVHRIGSRSERLDIVAELLGQVGLNASHFSRYPHSFSGGQRQRIGVARALALRPSLLLCDEPVSALDVSVQAQVLNLLRDLQSDLGLTYLFVSHNLAVVDYMADRIAVMCAGRVVELTSRERLFDAAAHPYTKALIAAVPEVSLDKPLDLKALMAGRVSDPAAWPEPFTVYPNDEPPFVEFHPGHFVRMRESVSDGVAKIEEAAR